MSSNPSFKPHTGPRKAPMGNSDVAIERKFTRLDFKRVNADGMFEGYASVFNREDLGRDVVAPKAFSQSLKQTGVRAVKLLFQHDPNQVIGVWHEIVEDRTGLFVKGQISTDVERGREVLALMRVGALDGLSIGFRAVEGRRNPRTGIRRLLKVDLWEISIVTFPMLPDARVTHVKTRPFAAHAPTEREFERWLTRDAGLTRKEARAVLRSGLSGLQILRDADGGNSGDIRLAQQIRDATRLLKCN